MALETTNPAVLSRSQAAAGLDALLDRVDATLQTLNGAFPYWADSATGRWETTPDGNWTAGHWIGLLWLASHYRDKQRFEAAARQHTAILKNSSENFCRSLFAGLNFYYAGFRGYDFSGDLKLLKLGFWGADTVVSLYNPLAGQIASGHFTIVGPKPRVNAAIEYDRKVWTSAGFRASAVDSLHVTVPILWRAYRESGNSRYLEVAQTHAANYITRFIRPDGSTRQRVEFDPESGQILGEHSDLGISTETCWARGLGWCIAGLAAAYNQTADDAFLDALERTVSFYVQNSPTDLVTYWDLKDSAIPATVRDTSAAAVIAYGLVGLTGDNPRLTKLRETGQQILASLVNNYLITDPNDTRRGMILHGCYNKSANYATDNELIWTNFYVASALHALLEKE